MERSLPKRTVAVQPMLCFFKGLGPQRAPVHPAIDASSNQASFFQHPDMSGDGRQRHLKWSCQFGNHRRTPSQPGQQSPPRSITQGMKYAVELGVG